MTRQLPAEYDGVSIDYAAFAVNEYLLMTLLEIAQRAGLLEYESSLPSRDGDDSQHYALLCNGTRLVLTDDEIPPFVLGLFVAAGKDLAPIAYRRGLVRSA